MFFNLPEFVTDIGRKFTSTGGRAALGVATGQGTTVQDLVLRDTPGSPDGGFRPHRGTGPVGWDAVEAMRLYSPVPSIAHIATGSGESGPPPRA